MNFFINSGIGPLILIIILSALGCTKVTIQSGVSKRHMRHTADSIIFNAVFFIFAAAFIALFFPLAKPDPTIIIYSSLTGLLTVTFQVIYSIALSVGPVSMTVLIMNFSSLISTTFSVIFFKEHVYLSQIFGIVMLVISIFMNHTNHTDEKKANKLWLILSLASLVVNGFASCAQKFFYATESSTIPNADHTMLVIMYVSAAAFAMMVYAAGLIFKKEKTTFGRKKAPYISAATVGLVMAAYQFFYMFALENMDGAYFFPTANGAQALVMTFIGVVFFKDSLSKRQKLGVVFGLLCVLFMNLKFVRII